MSGWSLRDLVREVYAEHGDISRLDVISIVMARVPEELTRAALQQAIPCFIRQMNSEGRMLSPRPEVSPQPNRSIKGEMIRNSWRRILDGRYPVTTDGGVRDMRLGEMTYDQLVEAAERCDDQARKNVAKADFLRGVADALTTHGVTCADELPEGTPLADAA